MSELGNNIMILRGLQATQKVAESFVDQTRGRVLALVGNLGSGKTTFAQFFLKALGVNEKITSPTFLIIKNYQLPMTNVQFKRAYHIDCYRLKDPTELLNLDFVNIIKNEENIVLIEWADKVKDLLPNDCVWIYFEHGPQEGQRLIKVDEKFLNS